MTLSEVIEKARIAGKPANWFFTEVPDTFKDHARKSWNGQARVICLCGKLFIQAANGCCAIYGVSFDDLMADDWEIVEDWECA